MGCPAIAEVNEFPSPVRRAYPHPVAPPFWEKWL
jgi:hypothetical protein